MDGNKPIPLHSVNVKMTRAMNSALNVLSANRSEAVRLGSWMARWKTATSGVRQ